MTITLSYYNIESALKVLGYSSDQLTKFKQKFLQSIVQSVGTKTLLSMSKLQQQELFGLLENPQANLHHINQLLEQFIPDEKIKSLKKDVVKKLLKNTFENILVDLSEQQKQKVFTALSKS